LKFIVDTNIVFSAILNTDSHIARILLEPESKYKFFSCEFLRHEINMHKSKILKITGYSEKEFLEMEYLVTKNITFINHLAIAPKKLNKARELCERIDDKDYPFVALCLHFKTVLWTGDLILLNGLKKKNFIQTITTSEFLRISKK